MNTKNPYTVPLLKEKRRRDYVFILEDLELAFPVDQLEEITDQWNNGMEMEEISKLQKRHIHEVFLALIHQAIKEKVTRPFAYRK